MEHSEMVAAFFEKIRLESVLEAIAKGLPNLKYAICFDEITSEDKAKFSDAGVTLFFLKELLDLGAKNTEVKAGGPEKEAAFEGAYNMRLAALMRGEDTPVLNEKVFDRMSMALGGRVKWILTGSAPLGVAIHEFLRVCVCPVILIGYGLTETTAGAAAAHYNDMKLGHVGAPLESNEIKLTKEAIDEEGWFHTGDVGRWNPDGTLSIIDRQKSIFKLSQGEYLAAENLEAMYGKCDHVAQVFVTGDSFHAYPVAVVVPDHELILAWAKANNVHGDVASIAKSAELNALLTSELEAMHKESKLNGFEKLKDFIVEPELFSIDNELLTPTFKLKRLNATKKYQGQIAQLYDEIENVSDLSKTTI
ncbi:hypothetical protein SARC_08205 [Sphaeroforma arctica JP610]|uniref:AMP-dependent synthetase/ligase domain-containing protein n=1 Tax=Sphaeroforma arctica JP610 TaxID=667725 RepID=A0A0L0FRK5_9EUKA|nr:hypothetical protein SARC_08205 [Sphaeroforma arctica JP610]KNC79405.1 hypothetical protein SARC_08205 [Sphaeroforma arctica JP610]|eukprot:XP_014153307.1 hypothetical protein SARC_08205 [Sphaeroforma arctica JP610]